MARVLVIDDEPDVLMLCRVNLQHAGHDVLEALDGERGLETARSAHPDVIVLDLMLPSMDGYEVLQMLQEDPEVREVPVLVLTAKAQSGDRARSWREGASWFITKPFSPDTLVEAVRRLTQMSPDELLDHRDTARRELTDD